MRKLLLALVALAACEGRPIGTMTTPPPNHPDLYDHPSVVTTTTALPTGQCPQWYATAIAAGWPAAEWPTIDRVMWAESRCQPDAYNPIGHDPYGHARGLMQIMDGLWAEECGITADQLYDPHLNLVCALHVFNMQGWQAWSTY